MAAIKKIKLPRVTTPYDILDVNAVHRTGDEEINGKKTFNNSPFVPTPTVDSGATPKSYVDSLIAGVADAMLFKGTLGQAKDGATVTALPANHKVGWTYKVVTAGTYAGMACEVGDMIACIKTRTTANNADWTVFQGNIDGAVTGPTSSTDAHVAIFNGATGKVIKDSGFTIGKSVPADAKFTDTQLTDGQIAAMGYTKNAVPIAGGTMTGNLKVGSASIRTNGYVEGTWLKTTADVALSKTPAHIAVLDGGWVHSRTPAQIKTDIGLGNVDNVKQYSSSNPPPYPVNSVNSKTGAVTLTATDVGARPSTWTPSKSDVGLGNVDNVKQYSASNPPPYPVTSVNGKTGAVTIEAGGSSIPVQANTPTGQKVGDLWFKVV